MVGQAVHDISAGRCRRIEQDATIPRGHRPYAPEKRLAYIKEHNLEPNIDVILKDGSTAHILKITDNGLVEIEGVEWPKMPFGIIRV